MMRAIGKFLATVFLAALTAMTASAQKTANGVVTDASDNIGIPGVSVFVKGTTIGTITDIDGKYKLEIPSDVADSVLVFSFVGYETQEIASQGGTVNVTLAEETKAINEVLVVGYGTMKKSDKTGAVTNVMAEDMIGGAITDPMGSLQGKAAGVTISKKGGDPGSGFSVKIRGAAGFGTETAPLYVVDGVPGVDPTTIASEDIESINILKDASSTAIYGSRGANGVVIITTKGGSSKKSSQVQFNAYVSADQVAKQYDLMSASDIRKYVSDNNMTSAQFTDGGADTDWQDELYRTGISQSYNFSVSGGNGNGTSYYASATHSEWEGVVIGTEKKRTGARINLVQNCLDNRLVVSSNMSTSFEHNDYISYSGWNKENVIYNALTRNPTDPVYNADGTYNDFFRYHKYKNPVATVDEIENERDLKDFDGNLKADLNIIKGLVASASLSYTRKDNENFYFEPVGAYLSENGESKRAYSNYQKRLAEFTVKYNFTKEKNNFDIVAGYSWQDEKWDGFSAGGTMPASDYCTSNALQLLQNVNPGDISSYNNSAKLISAFGRVAYNFDNKYYLTATVRKDGSSKFGDNNQWGTFPSVSVAWNIKQESFMQNIEMLSMLKLRAGWGMTGNEQIGVMKALTLIQSQGTAVNPEDGSTVVVFGGDKNANPDLKWEENKEYNIGIDFGFLNNRISGSIEYYNKTTDDLLYQYSVPVPPNTYSTIWANYGKINNSGIEFDVTGHIIDKPNFKWSANYTFSTNTQEVKKIDGGDYSTSSVKLGYIDAAGLIGAENWTQILKTGHELGSFYLPHYLGLNTKGEFVYTSTTGGVTTDVTQAQRFFCGNALPDYEMGFGSNFTFFKHWDFSFNLRALIGQDVYNGTKEVLGNPNGNLPNSNCLKSALTEIKNGLTSTAATSDYYLEDGSFLRCDNITLAYNFDTKTWPLITRCRVYFTTNNPFIITGYSGIDPEMSYTGSSSDLAMGIDMFNVYPKTRSFTFGVNLTF